jgi:hypothetical protein
LDSTEDIIETFDFDPKSDIPGVPGKASDAANLDLYFLPKAGLQ